MSRIVFLSLCFLAQAIGFEFHHSYFNSEDSSKYAQMIADSQKTGFQRTAQSQSVPQNVPDGLWKAHEQIWEHEYGKSPNVPHFSGVYPEAFQGHDGNAGTQDDQDVVPETRRPQARVDDELDELNQMFDQGLAAIGIITKKPNVQGRTKGEDGGEDEAEIEYNIAVFGKDYSLKFKPNTKMLPKEGFRIRWR